MQYWYKLYKVYKYTYLKTNSNFLTKHLHVDRVIRLHAIQRVVFSNLDDSLGIIQEEQAKENKATIN